MSHFLCCSQYCRILIMGKVVGCVYKHIQRNWPYPYTTKPYVLPKLSEFSIKTKSTSDYYTNLFPQSISLSHSDLNLNTIDDINVNYLDNLWSFETPRKHNQNFNTICNTTTQTTRHKPQTIILHQNKKNHCYHNNCHFLYQKNIISAFKIMADRSRQHSVKNQELSPKLLTPFYILNNFINSILILKENCSIKNGTTYYHHFCISIF